MKPIIILPPGTEFTEIPADMIQDMEVIGASLREFSAKWGLQLPPTTASATSAMNAALLCDTAACKPAPATPQNRSAVKAAKTP